MIRQSVYAYKAILEAYKRRLYFNEKHKRVYTKADIEWLKLNGVSVKVDEENQMVEFE